MVTNCFVLFKIEFYCSKVQGIHGDEYYTQSNFKRLLVGRLCIQPKNNPNQLNING